jgi:HAE1 family hydrophobic/amphiphilic exporter-1
MSIVSLSIKRPIFVSCIAIVFMVLGYRSLKTLGVDLFPEMNVPVVVVQTIYEGAGPTEVESQVTKHLEDKINTVSGIKKIRATNYESLSVVVAEFNPEVDVKYAEQQVRDKVNAVKYLLPDDIDDPIIERVDPNDVPIVVLTLNADNVDEGQLYDIADLIVKPKLEQIRNVGSVKIIGGREREIHVLLDSNKLVSREMSATNVYNRLLGVGQNIPSGSVDTGLNQIAFRSFGEFLSVKDIENAVINFHNNDNPTKVKDVATVKDTLKDEKTRIYVDNKQVLGFEIYKQTGSNTLSVANEVKDNLEKINMELKDANGEIKNLSLKLVRDGSRSIKINVDDVVETIIITIILTIIVIYLFLQNLSSTFIVCSVIPVALIGTFFLMDISNFTINIITLLSLTLAISTVIDDAILVKENTFRFAEMGYYGKKAAYLASTEVIFAIIATSLIMVAIYVPVSSMKGQIGSFLKQFGLVIVYSILISTTNALTMSPMLSAFMPDKILSKKDRKKTLNYKLLGWFDYTIVITKKFYLKLLRKTMKHSILTISLTAGIFYISLIAFDKTSKTFMPPNDGGEFQVSFELPTGSNVEASSQIGLELNNIIKENDKSIELTIITIGSSNEINKGNIYVRLVPFNERKGYSTTMAREKASLILNGYKKAIVNVQQFNVNGRNQRTLTLNLVGQDMEKLKDYSNLLVEKLKNDSRYIQPDTNYRDGKPELQIMLEPEKADRYGITTLSMGTELRAKIEGLTPAKFKDKGNEYDIRIRLQEEQRDLSKEFNNTYIPNINNRLVKISDVAQAEMSVSPNVIYRENKARYVEISSDLANGFGIGDAMKDIMHILYQEINLPSDIKPSVGGDADSFNEMINSFSSAIVLGILLTYLILSSLYESFITPITIILSIPLSVCGAFFCLYFTNQSINIMSMLGMIMLLSLATKAAVVLVDNATEQMQNEGKPIKKAIFSACKTRFRPVLMANITGIIGVIPIALGMNEASQQRVSLGWVLVGGMTASTILTLITVPSIFIYVDKLRIICLRFVVWFFKYKEDNGEKDF